MCNDNNGSAPKAHEFFRQKSQILRQNSGVSMPPVEAAADGAATRSASLTKSSKVASRPWSALQCGTRPLSAQKKLRRPVSAPRLHSGADDASEQALARFQDAWVARRGADTQKQKKPRDPFKDFLSDDPRIEQLKLERTVEDSHIRACKHDLHHKAILGKLDAVESNGYDFLGCTSSHQNSKKALPPVKGLHELQQHMIQSHKDLCASNPEAISSFITEAKVEKRRQRQKENLENRKRENFKQLKTQSSLNLKEFKTLLKAVQNPKPRSDLWDTSPAGHFRSRFRSHHDLCMLETLDVAQAVRIFEDRNR
jgi:hypothetical protein